jgi:hypothetical protein
MRRVGVRHPAAASIAVLLLCLAGTPAGAVNLLAHHATYVLSLAPGNQNGEITGAEGLMDFDLKDVCDGWATDLKLRFVMSLDSGETHNVDISQVTWEAKDGSAFRFLIKNGNGADQVDQQRGEARIDASGKAVATSDLPQQAEAKLPGGTLFPIAHTMLLLKKAAAGETVVTANYFDGTTPTQAMQASALIGAGEKNWTGLPKSFAPLKDLNSYPIGLAFYLGDQTDSTPNSEQFMRLFENGVLGELNFDLGNIKIHALLNELKLQPNPGC